MGNPAQAATQDSDGGNTELNFEQTVNETVKQVTRGSDGKYILPEGITPEVKHAAILEQRRRDTQSEYTKMVQNNKALSVENNVLKQKALDTVDLQLTKEQEEELDNLKFSDPEAWRIQVNILEKEALTTRSKDIDAEVRKLSTETLDKDEIEQRKDILIEFNQAHPEFKIDDDVISNDIPPRYVKKLETGEISFETFLQEIYEYSTSGKVINQEDTLGQPNIGKIAGGVTPDKRAQKEDITSTYSNEIY